MYGSLLLDAIHSRVESCDVNDDRFRSRACLVASDCHWICTDLAETDLLQTEAIDVPEKSTGILEHKCYIERFQRFHVDPHITVKSNTSNNEWQVMSTTARGKR
jgi:hypothetical protein